MLKQVTFLPERATLSPFSATKLPVLGYKFADSDNEVDRNGNKIACFRIQNRLFPDTKLPFLLATKLPVSGYKFADSDNEVARNGNKVACFRIQSCRFRQQVWTGHKATKLHKAMDSFVCTLSGKIAHHVAISFCFHHNTIFLDKK